MGKQGVKVMEAGVPPSHRLEEVAVRRPCPRPPFPPRAGAACLAPPPDARGLAAASASPSAAGGTASPAASSRASSFAAASASRRFLAPGKGSVTVCQGVLGSWWMMARMVGMVLWGKGLEEGV